MKLFLVLLMLLISSFNTEAQPIYTIPWASQQPKFVFPIYFEEGGGQRDTLYLGYDPNASLLSFNTSDSIYGVYKMHIDTNNFYVMWDAGATHCPAPNTLCTEVFKANVVSSSVSFPFPTSVASMYCNKGQLPLKISWDIKYPSDQVHLDLSCMINFLCRA